MEMHTAAAILLLKSQLKNHQSYNDSSSHVTCCYLVATSEFTSKTVTLNFAFGITFVMTYHDNTMCICKVISYV